MKKTLVAILLFAAPAYGQQPFVTFQEQEQIPMTAFHGEVPRLLFLLLSFPCPEGM